MKKQLSKNGKKHSFKKKYKKMSPKKLELQYQLKEFLKLQQGAYPEQPILSIREYEKKKKFLRSPQKIKKRIVR